ncbi:MAG: DUF4861 family protein [Paludibacter sp.]|nr:DUF4861 family protein [Paludibacter sp.]
MKTNYEIRYASHPDDAKKYDTARLRKEFLIETLFVSNEVNMVYTLFDRLVVGGAMPVNESLVLEAIDPLKSEYFLSRRELGIHFNRYEIIENGPLRSTFTLYYENVKVGGVVMNQEITISTTAGSALNKAVVKYTGKVPFQLAAGIVLHNDKGIKHSNVKTGVIAYAEDAISSAKLPSGRNYIGVVMPCKAKAIATQDNHLLITAKYKPESNFTYYFGGGWSKWHFTTDADWFSAMEQFSKRVKQPLQVKFK